MYKLAWWRKFVIHIYRYVDNFPFSFYTSVLYLLKWLIITIFLSHVYHFIINEWIKKKLVKIFELWNSLLGSWYKTDDWWLIQKCVHCISSSLSAIDVSYRFVIYMNVTIIYIYSMYFMCSKYILYW